ncbi:MAG: GNAT family N-acetyltransferase [Candidatus Nanopelagicales bacterium]
MESATGNGDPPTIVRVDAEQVWPLRRRILRPGMSEQASIYPQDHEEMTHHWAIFDTDVVVACLTQFPERYDNRHAWRLRGMAVDPAFQGGGFGTALFEKARQVVVAEGAEIFWCNARVSAAEFYEKLGFELIGPVFLTEPGVPHRVAVMRLNFAEM